MSYDNHKCLPDGIIPTKLMTHNKQVESINSREFAALDGEVLKYTAEDSTDQSHIVKLLNSMLPNVAQTVELKLNAQVMLTRNLSVATGTGFEIV